MFPCLSQSSQNICSLNPPVGTPPALDNINVQTMGGIMLSSDTRINLDSNLITASTAAVVDSFSFVFVSFTDSNGISFLSGVSTIIIFSEYIVRIRFFFTHLV